MLCGMLVLAAGLLPTLAVADPVPKDDPFQQWYRTYYRDAKQGIGPMWHKADEARGTGSFESGRFRPRGKWCLEWWSWPAVGRGGMFSPWLNRSDDRLTHVVRTAGTDYGVNWLANPKAGATYTLSVIADYRESWQVILWEWW
jgi:hypothetical protein